MSRLRWFLVVLAVGVTACSSGGADGDKAATSSSELRVTSASYLGTIASGETKTSSYADPPKYRAYGFTARGGDVISIDVTSGDGGDAMAWLTDDTYANTLAFNDDANASTLDSHIDYTVPDGTPSSSYRIVFRDYNRADATFDVTLQITSSSTSDGGSTDCDPANEPWRNYLYTPKQCAAVRYTCPAGWHAFQNACGCGCE
jgi:hypothetical protein